MISKVGYALIIKTWENDLDHSASVVIEGLEENEVIELIKFCKLFESNGNKELKNPYEFVKDFLETTESTYLHEIFYFSKEDEEYYDDMVYETLCEKFFCYPFGDVYRYEYEYFIRKLAGLEVYYVPVVYENVTNKFL